MITSPFVSIEVHQPSYNRLDSLNEKVKQSTPKDRSSDESKMVEYITVNGASLAYEITGPASAPLMITLHGGRGMGMHYPSPPLFSDGSSDNSKKETTNQTTKYIDDSPLFSACCPLTTAAMDKAPAQSPIRSSNSSTISKVYGNTF